MGDERTEFLNTAVTAAQRAGKIIRENLGHTSKNDISFVCTSPSSTLNYGQVEQ
jgi:hypothetical protein